MEILKAAVKWYFGFGNSPNLVIQVDEMPRGELFSYQKRGSLYFAEHEGWCRFYAYSGPGRGFGGAEIVIYMEDGTAKTLIGPWSSRPGVMNAAGFEPHCVDVTCVEKKSGYRYGTAISLELAQKAAAMAGVTLELDDDGDDLTYRIAEPKPEGKTESDDIISF